MQLFLAKNWLAAVAAVAAGAAAKAPYQSQIVNRPSANYIPVRPCPDSCIRGTTPSNWTVFHDTNSLAICSEPLLVDFSIWTPLDKPNVDVTLRTCTSGNADTTINTLTEEINKDNGNSLGRRDETSTCGKATESKTTAQLARWGPSSSSTSDTESVITAARKIQEYLKDDSSSCGKATIIASYVKGTVVGFYAGKMVQSESLVKQLIDRVKNEGAAPHLTAQVCGHEINADHVVGIVSITAETGDIKSALSTVQRTFQSWAKAKCVDLDGADALIELKETTISTFSEETPSALKPRSSFFSFLSRRADCQTTRVVDGDTCATLARRCGISSSNFLKYNTKTDLCSTLTPGQPICCSEGTLPDIRPQPGSDGICATHTVQADEYCQLIASSNGLTVDELKEFNNGKTWGWNGCDNLQLGINICLSDGDPPMPAPVSNAVCGPTVPGSSPPTYAGDTLADLNPCPLNACCNIWGQCGLTVDFCIESESETGNPGTSAPGENGCISNCGMDIVNNSTAPGQFKTIGYFEGWNVESRECLRMHVSRANTNKEGSERAWRYRTIHFAFAEITPDLEVHIPDNSKAQFDAFLKDEVFPYQKVLSFGGWAFSNNAATWRIFADAVNDANRIAFAEKVVDFAVENKLDGLDFDWEYPGAEDLVPEGMAVPDDIEEQGMNYYKFLAAVRRRLPTDISLSIAAPAGYWYLKNFPINEISHVVDYIVYMTYDFHGQWDAGSEWASSGCPSGNCLRSHVNFTETYNSLAMITKAGVPSHKVIMGVSSYGRSFKMAQPGCDTETCFFLGDRNNSPAKPGRCTATAGYIANAEINEILPAATRTWYDPKTMTDYLVYDETEWVAYMTEDTKARRGFHAINWNLGGVVDWAVDLQDFHDDGDTPFKYDYYANCPDWDSNEYETMEALAEAGEKSRFPKKCGYFYLIPILKKIYDDSIDEYKSILDKDDYDEKFDIYADAIAREGPLAARTFLQDHGDRYFQCDVVERISCCYNCHDKYGEGSKECQHCTTKCQFDAPLVDHDGFRFEYRNITMPCPPDLSRRGLPDRWGSHTRQTIYWTLREDKTESFWDDLYSRSLLNESDIRWGRVVAPGANEGGDPAYGCLPDYATPGCQTTNLWFNTPVPTGFGPEDIPDPKESILEALDELEIFEGIFAEVRKLIEHDDSDPRDIVHSMQTTILMLESAVMHMKEVVRKANEETEEDWKTLIVNLVGAFLLLVPPLGKSFIVARGLANTGKWLSIASEAGNYGFGLWQMIDDPKNIPGVIGSTLLGWKIGGSDLAKRIAETAVFRRLNRKMNGMPADIQAKFDWMDEVFKLD